jgi:hypothetical protein
MGTSLVISILGAISAILVSVIAAFLANRNNLVLQTRKLKEDHYISYIEALHYLNADNNGKDVIKNYVFARDKLFIIASENVINKLLAYEEAMPKVTSKEQEIYLTELIKSIRADLKLTDKNFPHIYFKTHIKPKDAISS